VLLPFNISSRHGTRAWLPMASAALALCLLSLAGASAQEPVADDDFTVNLFFSPSCTTCHKVRAHLDEVMPRHPEFTLQARNLGDASNIETLADFYIAYSVPEEDWGGTMALFVADRHWTDLEPVLTEFEAALEAIASGELTAPESSALPDPLDVPPTDDSGHDWLVSRFERFGVATVALAGLVDGVNPCALAALIFLISFLSFAGRKPREILATGLLFAAGVFAAYFAVGLGLFRGLQMLSGFSLVSKLLYPIMALLTLGLTVYSLRDWLLARSGRAKEMSLKLPRKVLGLSHTTIRTLIGGPWFLALAFVAGLIISLLELLCTGQIYLPTLMYIASTDELRGRALGLLVVYVSLFTLPIVALTLASYWGVTSERIVQLGKRHTAATKLALTVVFALLTVYLAAFSFSVWFT